MPTYLIRSNSAWQWPIIPDPQGDTVDQPHNTALTGQFENGDNAWLIVSGSNPVDDYAIDGLVIGCWNQDGSNVEDFDEDGNSLGIRHPVTDDYYELRPLGNRPTGQATKQLRYSYAAGWRQRWLREDWFYPADNDTVTIETRHKFFDFPTPQAGWGYRSEIRYAGRTPGNRNMAIYNDPECSDLRYNGGAFQLRDSEWYFDEDGNPEQAWISEPSPAQRTDEKEDLHHALISGGNQEGHLTLLATEDSVTANFWENDLQAANRLVFLGYMNSQPSVSAVENGFNRVEIRKGPEKITITWRQIIERTFIASPALTQIINDGAIAAGWPDPMEP